MDTNKLLSVVVSKCYASCLGDCSSKISREHFISESLLDLSIDPDGKVVVDGLLSKDGLRLTTKNTAVAKILCKKHNEDLSDYDSCFSLITKELMDFNHNSCDKEISFSGKEATLWLIKTFLGSIAVRNLQKYLHGGQNQFDYLVNILFSKLEFNNAFGFTLAEEDPPKETQRDEGFSPWVLSIVRSGKVIVGIKAWVYPFVLTFLVPGINYNGLRPLGCSLKVLGSSKKTLDFKINW